MEGRGVETSRCQLCSDICLVTINFILKWITEDTLDELGLYCKTQPKSRLHLARVKEGGECILHYCHSAHLWIQKRSRQACCELRLCVAAVLMWEEKMSLEFHMSKQVL